MLNRTHITLPSGTRLPAEEFATPEAAVAHAKAIGCGIALQYGNENRWLVLFHGDVDKLLAGDGVTPYGYLCQADHRCVVIPINR